MADFGGDLNAFRTDVRDWLKANYPAELKDPAAGRPEAMGRAGVRRLRRSADRLDEADGRPRLDRADVAQALWRRRARA